MNLTEERALCACASMMNSLDASRLEELLADDFHYASQWVFAEIESKAAYLEYIVPKLEAIRKSGTAAWAEKAWLDREFPGPCVVMAQGCLGGRQGKAASAQARLSLRKRRRGSYD